MDRRQSKTRAAIFRAFTDLIGKYAYSQITVQKIIDAADIGRTTFYTHFETKDTLLKALCEDLFGHIVSGAGAACPLPTLTPSDSDYRAFVTHILYHLADRREAFTRLLASDSRDLFLRYFKEELYRRLAPLWLREGSAPPRDIPADYLLNHFTSSFVESMDWWIRHGMHESPETVTEYFAAVIDPVLTTAPPMQAQDTDAHSGIPAAARTDTSAAVRRRGRELIRRYRREHRNRPAPTASSSSDAAQR